MAVASKEERLLKLLLEQSPLREWHFEELRRATGIARGALNKWLQRYVTEGLLTRVKEPGRFPGFTVGKNNPVYYARKRFYALEQLYKTGFIQHLLGLKAAKTVIVFGSMAKGDWYKDSDLDLFIFGDDEGFDKKLYEEKLGRTIEVHVFENKDELKAVRTGLLRNVLNGYLVKGDVHDLAEAGA